MGKIVKKVAPVAALGGIGLLGGGGIKNLLFGKKEGPDAEADTLRRQLAESSAASRQGLSQLREVTNETPEQIRRRLQFGVQQQGKSLRGQAGDERRRIQELIAKRGLGRTSVGLGAQNATNIGIRDRLAQLRAGVPGQVRAEQLANANSLISGARQAGPAGNVPIKFGGGRKGGIAELVGTAAGATLGGAAGAQIGAGVGGAARGAFG